VTIPLKIMGQLESAKALRLAPSNLECVWYCGSCCGLKKVVFIKNAFS